MSRVLVSLLLLSLLACDQTTDDQTYAQLDTRLRGMSGASERQLLGAMGRIPDNSYRLGDQIKVLQWRWDTAYSSPSCTSRRWGGGGYPQTWVHENCIVEWTVSNGTSQTYRWQGYGCKSVDLVNFAVP
jgi:hypothetical protein